MGELAATTSPPPPASASAVVPVVFVDGEQSVDLGTVTVLGGVKRLQAVVADRVGVAPHQISASLARPRRARRVPLDDDADLAAAVAREGTGCYVGAPPPLSLPLPHAGAGVLHGGWGYDDYEARLRELQRQRDWYLMSTAGPDPSYFHLAAAAAAGAHPEHEDLWSPMAELASRTTTAARVLRDTRASELGRRGVALVVACPSRTAELKPAEQLG